MIVVDSSVLIDLFQDRDTQQVKRLEVFLTRRERVLLDDLVLLEVLRGASNEGEAVRVREKLVGLDPVEVGGEGMALLAAFHYRLLRRKGVTMSTVDLLIGTFCIANGHRLLHNDRHFRPMVEHLGLVEA